ncbi:MAG TPA: CBS domain-containing protein [Firmicutes bacterium]|nr:CBS domain-containing protein [Bacillota bacterium]
MTEQSNSERFLNAFSAIEHEMGRILNIKDHRRFFELVDKSARVNPVIERFRFDLREYSELRNAIVHDRAGGEIIAEPNNEVVHSIERIAALLLEPPKVAPLFLKEVLSLKASDPVSKAVRAFSRFSYTQAPVIEEEKMVGLLTSNMIVKWMGISLADESFDIDKTTVGDVIKVVGHEKEYEIVPVTRPLFDIPDLFYSWQKKGRKLEAVLITQNGQKDEPLLGIITNRDLPQIHRELGQNGKEQQADEQ